MGSILANRDAINVAETTAVAEPDVIEAGPEPELQPAEAGAPPAAAEEPTAAEWQGVRDFAKAQGVELPYQDDAQALTGLLQAYRRGQERDYYSDLGRQFAPHQETIRKYLEDQQRAAVAAPDEPRPWEPPPYDQSWVSMVERDPETGLIRAKAGYDPAVADKLKKYADWREQFLVTPHKVMKGMLEEEARRITREELSQHRQRELADRIVESNSSWLFQSQDGRPTVGPDGKRQLTPEGVLYTQTVQSLTAAGIQDVELLGSLARAIVENAVLRQKYGGAAGSAGTSAPPTGEGAAASPAARSASGGGAAKGGGSGAKPSSKGMSLREMLDRKLKNYPAEVG